MNEPASINILVINPGQVTLKLAWFRGRTLKEETEDQFSGDLDEALKQTLAFLGRQNLEPSDLGAVVARGGLVGPVTTGTYLVDQNMLTVLREERFGKHASNLGAQTASLIAQMVPCPAWIVDPVSCDDLMDEARITGLKEIRRRVAYHALSHGAVGRRLADRLGRNYQDCLLLVAHLGSGITVAAHRRGRVVEVNNGLEGEGPFAPTRSGGLMVVDAVRHLGGLDEEEFYQRVTRRGGFVSLFGTADALTIEKQLQSGDQEAELFYRAFEYRVAREIAAQAMALGDRPDALGLTGGLARWNRLVKGIGARTEWIAPLHVFAGTYEMTALAEGALRAVSGEAEVKRIPGSGGGPESPGSAPGQREN